MRASLVRIGNSRGVRIPKAMIEACRLGETVELEVRDGELIIRPVKHPREGWAEACRRAAELGDDELLDGDAWPATEFDKTEWEW